MSILLEWPLWRNLYSLKIDRESKLKYFVYIVSVNNVVVLSHRWIRIEIWALWILLRTLRSLRKTLTVLLIHREISFFSGLWFYTFNYEIRFKVLIFVRRLRRNLFTQFAFLLMSRLFSWLVFGRKKYRLSWAHLPPDGDVFEAHSLIILEIMNDFFALFLFFLLITLRIHFRKNNLGGFLFVLDLKNFILNFRRLLLFLKRGVMLFLLFRRWKLKGLFALDRWSPRVFINDVSWGGSFHVLFHLDFRSVGNVFAVPDFNWDALVLLGRARPKNCLRDLINIWLNVRVDDNPRWFPSKTLRTQLAESAQVTFPTFPRSLHLVGRLHV